MVIQRSRKVIGISYLEYSRHSTDRKSSSEAAPPVHSQNPDIVSEDINRPVPVEYL